MIISLIKTLMRNRFLIEDQKTLKEAKILFV